MPDSPKKWACSVCGYLHGDPTAPDFCPVCGATKDLFEPYTLPVSIPEKPAPEKWRCLNCEYIHDGGASPEYCPVCGAPAERFEPFTEEPVSKGTSREKRKIVIVGGGIAGVSAAEAVRNTSSQAEIYLMVKEPDLPYFRLNLTRYLAGEISESDLALHPESWYGENSIQLLRNSELCSIDTEKKALFLRGREPFDYDTLILTIGSHPFVPPFPGANRENVTVLRTKADADFILEQCKNPLRCVVIGGGLLGLETAGALAKRGIDVTLLEGHGWLLPRQLNAQAGSLLRDQVTAVGIKLKSKALTKEIVGDERVRGVLLEDGETIPAELVIIATGVRSNSYVARIAGLDVNIGVVVNNRLQTSNPDIFAAGDVAEHRGVAYGTWGPSQFMGTIAGINAASGNAEFVGIPRSNMLKVLGYDLFSIGKIIAEDASYRIIESQRDNNYYFFLFRDNHMIGSILLGNTELSSQVKRVVEKELDCSNLLEKDPAIEDILDFVKEV